MAIFRDRASYKLGRSGRLVINPGVRDELRAMMHERGVKPAGDAMARRLNASSTWGGFVAVHGRKVSWVSALSANRNSDRGRRMLTAANKAADTL